MNAVTLRTAVFIGVWLAITSQYVLAQGFPASVTARSASEALQFLLDRNIQPGGPLGGDGATIAGVLAGQSLTFPIASSSGAFVTRRLKGFGPELPIAMSGSFGPLFAERGLTNGRSNLSVSLTYQHKRWGTVSGIGLKGYDLLTRAVFRDEVPGAGPAGTVEEFAASIDFRTDVVVGAVNYGIMNTLDVGLSVPYVRAIVDGDKRRVRTLPQHNPVTLYSQHVSGQSEGLGDPIVRVKYRIPFWAHNPGSAIYQRLHIAVGYDFRIPTGKTAQLFLDCSRPPCEGGATQEVPDVGLGKRTQKLSVLASSAFGRFSPHVNVGHVWVPPYKCDERRFGSGGRCKGSIFDMDALNGTEDAKNQNLSDEWNGTAGFDYELLPYRATLSADLLARQLIRAGQFYVGPARLIFRNEPDRSVATQIESRHGNVNTLLGVIGTKIGFHRTWVLNGTVLFPLNRQGLQTDFTWVIGVERAFTR